jgi:putative PIN family toxin of toxin-antitoxin system
MIRAVLDANVFVSGILSPAGTPGKLIAAWRRNQFFLITSAAILAEIARVLRYPRIARRHRWSPKEPRSLSDTCAVTALKTQLDAYVL